MFMSFFLQWKRNLMFLRKTFKDLSNLMKSHEFLTSVVILI